MRSERTTNGIRRGCPHRAQPPGRPRRLQRPRRALPALPLQLLPPPARRPPARRRRRPGRLHCRLSPPRYLPRRFLPRLALPHRCQRLLRRDAPSPRPPLPLPRPPPRLRPTPPHAPPAYDARPHDRPDTGPTLDEHVQRLELARCLQEALASLPPDQRLAAVLCDVQGLPYEEIAQVMGVSLGTVKSRTSRARARPRKALMAH